MSSAHGTETCTQWHKSQRGMLPHKAAMCSGVAARLLMCRLDGSWPWCLSLPTLLYSHSRLLCICGSPESHFLAFRMFKRTFLISLIWSEGVLPIPPILTCILLAVMPSWPKSSYVIWQSCSLPQPLHSHYFKELEMRCWGGKNESHNGKNRHYGPKRCLAQSGEWPQALLGL